MPSTAISSETAAIIDGSAAQEARPVSLATNADSLRSRSVRPLRCAQPR